MQHIIKILSKVLMACLVCPLLVAISGCKKDWLDAKPEKALVVPSTIRDYQAMLDNNSNGSAPFNTSTIALGEIGAGDFYVSNTVWTARTPLERNTYIWAPDIYGLDKSYSSWEFAYNNILYTNIILEGIEKIVPTNNAEVQEWNQVKGSALFFRAYRHYDVAQVFCKPFDKSTASTDLGIPLKLQSNYNVVSIRSSVGDTYNQILSDLKRSTDLLPIEKPTDKIYKLRPTKTAAYAMLARVYLNMSIYDSSLNYANKALQLYNALMDYNSSPPILPGVFRIPRFNDEVILNMIGGSYPILSLFNASVDSILYNSYDINDKRRNIFYFPFNGTPRFVGSYQNGTDLFTGLATDELYLIRAECYARAGNKDAALTDLNTLMQKRWSNNGTWVPFTATSASDVLRKILIERRKELCFRYIRWSDLRRLNKEPQFAVTLTRIINAQTYTLPPNSPLYVLPIPPDVITLTGMQQNPR
jgi:tetratricopeptide (TPR) repeat protein